MRIVARNRVARLTQTLAIEGRHSFSQTSKWFQDYAAFVSLLGGSAKSENSSVLVGVRSGISLHLAWVRGDAQCLSK
jgi:hypothetical protein